MTVDEKKKLHKGDEIEVTIESLVFGGAGLARIDGAVIFIKDAIPGQRMMVRITKKRPNYYEARKLELLEKAPDEIEPICQHFADCGGCKFQHLTYEKQLEFKRQQVEDNLRRIGGFKDVQVANVIAADPIFRYRNKMEFTFSNSRWICAHEDEGVESDFAFGLHAPGRYDKVLDIEHCHLLSEIGNDIFQTVKQFVRNSGEKLYDLRAHTGYFRYLVIREGTHTQEIMVNIVTNYDAPEKLLPLHDIFREKFPQITTFINGVQSGIGNVSYTNEINLIDGSETISDTIGDLTFDISAYSFFQTNTIQTKALYDVAVDFADLHADDIVYDLYCGTGTIGLYLAKRCKEVIGMEVVPSAIDDAVRNALKNEIYNARFVLGDVNHEFRNLPNKKKNLPAPHVIIIDPPRAGITEKIANRIVEQKPRTIVYISCNPATQSRDLQWLCAEYYNLEKIQPVDMFPHTPHIENVVKLSKKEGTNQ